MNMKKLINTLALAVLVLGMSGAVSVYADDDYKDAAKAQKKADEADLKATKAAVIANKKNEKAVQKQDKIQNKQDKKIERELDKAN
jgi:hypothetical protein